MANRHREIKRDFTGGLNTRDKDSMLHESESPDMMNVLTGKRGGFKPRPGTEVAFNNPVSLKRQDDGSFYPVTSIYEIVKEGGDRHFLAFSCDELKRAGTTEWQLIRDGFTMNTYFEFIYHPFENKILFVNGADGYWETDATDANKIPYYSPQEYGDPGDPGYVDEAVAIGSSVMPDRAKYIAWFDNRVWLANVQGHADRIYYNVNNILGSTIYNYFTTWSWMRASSIRGEPITAIKVFDNQLFVFTNTSIKIIRATDPIVMEGQEYIPPSYEMVDFSTVIGAVSQRSVQEVSGSLLFLSADGVYLIGRGSPFKISGKIDPTLSEASPEHQARSCGGLWEGKYFLSIPKKQGGE